MKSEERNATVILRQRFGITLAIVHLSLVSLGAANVDVSRFGLPGKVIEIYGGASGSADSYGFFAPGIDGQLRARFEIFDSKGKASGATLESGVSHEADLRVENIIDQFQDNHAHDPMKFQRAMAASLAGSLLKRHPEARQVAIYLENYESVTMEEYRRGVVPAWTPVYEAKFAREQETNLENGDSK